MTVSSSSPDEKSLVEIESGVIGWRRKSDAVGEAVCNWSGTFNASGVNKREGVRAAVNDGVMVEEGVCELLTEGEREEEGVRAVGIEEGVCVPEPGVEVGRERGREAEEER